MKLISSCIEKKGISIIVLIFFTFIFIPSLMTTNGEGKEESQTGTRMATNGEGKEESQTGTRMETNGEGKEESQTGTISINAVIVAASIIIIAFMGILILGWLKDRNLDQGKMRRAIAGTFVVGFTILTVLCLHSKIYQKEVIIAYIELVGIVIGFYFGAKTAEEKKSNLAAMIDIENSKSSQIEKSKIIELRKTITEYYNKNSSNQEEVETAVKKIGYANWKNLIDGIPADPTLKHLEQIKTEMKI